MSLGQRAGSGEDDGAADPRLREAIARHAAGEESPQNVLGLLADARLLVPAVPSPTSENEMVWVQTTGRDGRIGMLAFTGVDSLSRFDASARPMPMQGSEVAAAALQTGAAALVIDIAGPSVFAVETRGLDVLSRAAAAEED